MDESQELVFNLEAGEIFDQPVERDEKARKQAEDEAAVKYFTRVRREDAIARLRERAKYDHDIADLLCVLGLEG